MEVLESGPEPGRGRPRWLPPVILAVLVLAIAVWLLTRTTSPEPPPVASQSSSPSVSPSASPPPSASDAETAQSSTATPQPWPSRTGACGSIAWLPLSHTGIGPLPHVRLLLGGAQLTLVDVAAGTRRTLWNPGGDISITDLQPDPRGHGTYLVAAPCSPDAAAVLWQLPALDEQPQHVRGALAIPWLVPGQHGPWQVQTPYGLDDVSSSGFRMREVASGATATLPEAAEPIAVTDAGLVVAGGSAANNTPRTQLWSTRGQLLHDYGPGWPLGVTPRGDVLTTTGNCNVGDTQPCHLRLLDPSTGRLLHRYVLPAGQYVNSGIAVDPASRHVGFVLSLPSNERPYDTGHPFPASRLVILNLATGALTTVPGIELAPKTNAGLALATNGWIFASLSFGDHGEVVAWRDGLPAPIPVVDLPGPLTQAPPVQLQP